MPHAALIQASIPAANDILTCGSGLSAAQLNTTLVSLELNSNSIDYDGATALAEAIAETTSLTALYLRCRI